MSGKKDKNGKRIRMHFKINVYGDVEGVKIFRTTIEEANKSLALWKEADDDDFVQFNADTPSNATFYIKKGSIISLIATEMDEVAYEKNKKKKIQEAQYQQEMSEKAKEAPEVASEE